MTVQKSYLVSMIEIGIREVQEKHDFIKNRKELRKVDDTTFVTVSEDILEGVASYKVQVNTEEVKGFVTFQADHNRGKMTTQVDQLLVQEPYLSEGYTVTGVTHARVPSNQPVAKPDPLRGIRKKKKKPVSPVVSKLLARANPPKGE